MADSDAIADGGFGKPIAYIGRYALFSEIAQGGFASVHLGRSIGAGGFARTVAIKRLHQQYARDPEVSAMFLDEAKIVARIRHPNVLPTLDLIDDDDELFIVMEYVEGVTFRHLMRHASKRKRKIPLGVTLRILCGVLHGLHAAHEARSEQGELLHLVHRDMSPDNILIGTDGLPRLLDFGVARALGQYHSTRSGEVKGKLAYLTPEQVKGETISRRTDIFSASVVLWEAMTGKRLFAAKSIAAMAHKLINGDIPAPSELADVPKKLDGIVLQGLDRTPDKRWASAQRMASALEAVGELASEHVVARYVRQVGGDRLTTRAKQVAAVEAADIDHDKAGATATRLSASGVSRALAVTAQEPVTVMPSAMPADGHEGGGGAEHTSRMSHTSPLDGLPSEVLPDELPWELDAGRQSGVAHAPAANEPGTDDPQAPAQPTSSQGPGEPALGPNALESPPASLAPSSSSSQSGQPPAENAFHVGRSRAREPSKNRRNMLAIAGLLGAGGVLALLVASANSSDDPQLPSAAPTSAPSSGNAATAPARRAARDALPSASTPPAGGSPTAPATASAAAPPAAPSATTAPGSATAIVAPTTKKPARPRGPRRAPKTPTPLYGRE